MANYLKLQQFEKTNILVSDWITNKETVKKFDKKDFCLAYYPETFEGITQYYYKIVRYNYIEEHSFQLVSELPAKKSTRQEEIYNIITKHYNSIINTKKEKTTHHI